MKKITLLFLIILLSVSYSLHAQKSFAGEIRFESKLEGTDDPNLLSSETTLVQTITVLGNKSKTVTVIAESVAVTQIWDGDKETSAVFIEIPMYGKFYKKWNKEEHKEKLKLTNYTYNYENEFITICDYKCQKVVVTATNLEDDSQIEIILFVTKDIGTSKLNGDKYVGLEGFPLMTRVSVETHCDGCEFVFQATKITPKKVKDVDFLLPDGGINYEDIQDPELKEGLKDIFGTN